MIFKYLEFNSFSGLQEVTGEIMSALEQLKVGDSALNQVFLN